jgi:hypothetical protein
MRKERHMIRRKHGSLRAFTAAGLFILGLLSAGSSVAQDYRGRVQGLVTDSSQASVTGARIALRNVNTGVENVQQSNELGQYLFGFVEPGTYSVTGEMVGFSKFIGLAIRIDNKSAFRVGYARPAGRAAGRAVQPVPRIESFDTANRQGLWHLYEPRRKRHVQRPGFADRGE